MSTKSQSTKLPSSQSTVHFVLVHGAFHGAWCWYKIRCLLESVGHKVTCLDLRSQGIDPSDPNTLSKFDDYNQPLDDFLSGLGEGEKVILAGHSAGGVNVTAAIHKYPQKIRTAVYVVGEMVKNGKRPSKPDDEPVDTEMYDFYYGEGPDNPPTSCILKKEFIQQRFYNRCPLEDVTLAAMLLKPWPIRAFSDVQSPDDPGDKAEKVPRVYIKTLDDNAISQEGQDELINNWPPSAVYSVDSDHCPFFSNPFRLFGLLLKVARTEYGDFLFLADEEEGKRNKVPAKHITNKDSKDLLFWCNYFKGLLFSRIICKCLLFCGNDY